MARTASRTGCWSRRRPRPPRPRRALPLPARAGPATAGGSSSFARHGFNELVSFAAAWAQMLVYVVTVAASAFFVPHYLSIFWGPLKDNPWDIVGGAVVIVLLVVLNTVGVQEAARLSV